jgi:peptidoglycan/LPS O-acetylase OafA/YrhL
MQNRSSFRHVSRLGSRPWFFASLGLLITVQGLTHVLNPTADGFRVASPYYYLPYSIAAALVVASLVLRAPGSGSFESAPMRLIGRVSYPLYLTHPIALALAAAAIAPGGLTTELVYLGVGLSLSIALAYGLHRVVEKPLVRIGKRRAERIAPHRAPAPAAAAGLAPVAS